ncbi:MAG: hypothetical protein ACI9HK_003545 [Pirellulaceae bacterium]|jgi:hypothetical protein
MGNKNRSKEKEEFWRMVVSEFETRGQSVRDFCRAEEIGEASFYGWRREIARRDAEGGGVEPAIPNLLPVTVVDLENTSQHENPPDLCSGEIEIQTPGGVTIRLREAVTNERMRTVLNVVEQL